jgi:hypothetical protein
VSDGEAAAAGSMLGTALAVRRGFPLVPAEREALTHAVREVMSRRGGVLNRYSDLIGLVVATAAVASGAMASPADRAAAIREEAEYRAGGDGEADRAAA